MIDLLIVARADPKVVASTRYRVAKMLPYVAAAGIRFRLVLPPRRRKVFWFLWPVFYLRVLVFGALAKTILVQKDIFSLPLWRLFKLVGKRIVYDFDDAIFVEGDAGESRVYCLFSRRRPKNLVAEMIRIADRVTVANNYLLDFARRFTDNAELFPMPVDVDSFTSHPREDRYPVTIGWIGTAQTAPYLSLLEPALRDVSRHYKSLIRIRMITPAEVPLKEVEFEQQEWSLVREAADILSFDIGIVPLPSGDAWAEGKSSYKLLQFMAAGLAVVCSRVGYNKDIVVHGVNGFLASTTEEWIESLERLIKDAQLRRQVGLAARETVRKECSLETLVPRYLKIVAPVES